MSSREIRDLIEEMPGQAFGLPVGNLLYMRLEDNKGSSPVLVNMASAKPTEMTGLVSFGSS